MAEAIHVAGPFRRRGKWLLLCPVCDDDELSGLDGAARTCTSEWLAGQLLRGDAGFGERTCYAFETDPYESVPDATEKQRRYFYYHTVSRLLGSTGRRVDLPGCVKDRIEDLHGESTTGFKDNSASP